METSASKGRLSVLLVVCLALALVAGMFLLIGTADASSLPSPAAFNDSLAKQSVNQTELILNGDFSTGTDPWWKTDSISWTVDSGVLSVTVLSGGVNPFDAIFGQHGIALEAGAAYTLTFEAWADQEVAPLVILQLNEDPWTQYFSQAVPLTTTPQTYTYTFTSGATNPATTFQIQLGGLGEYEAYFDNFSLISGEGEVEVLPVVRLNQVGYLPDAPKQATISTTATSPISFTLYDVSNTVMLTGTTSVFGPDEDSGEHVHIADFSEFMTPGEGYTLEAAEERSHPFDISYYLYEEMQHDALRYFYLNRSGITLTMPYVEDEMWARPAGHINVPPNQGDIDIPCFNLTDTVGMKYEGCDYTLDVSGGWYDAGDYGKYVVNGGISVWTLMNQYERFSAFDDVDMDAIEDGTLNIPESGNLVPDILDEARWELEFMLSMQVPPTGTVEGEQLGGMVHHKVHDVEWTGLRQAPHEDPMARYLYPPSTAATLNLAAVGAQCARIWEEYDPDFANRCLMAAETAWDAANAHPDLYAENNFTGGGPYDDTDVSDEFYWAATELFITTGEEEYRQFITGSDLFLTVMPTGTNVITGSAMAWQETAALATIDLALVRNDLTTTLVHQARDNIIAVADQFLAAQAAQGNGIPYDSQNGYVWGSNSLILNNMMILGLAYDFTHEVEYLNGVSLAMDYLLGRNPNDQSYVTGYGDRPLQNPHHRFWANQANANYPTPPPGAVSGGPNSAIEDPYAQAVFPEGCLPQKCFVDNIQSWSTNEITINWNAPFAWVTAFLQDRYEFYDGYVIFYPLIHRMVESESGE